MHTATYPFSWKALLSKTILVPCMALVIILGGCKKDEGSTPINTPTNTPTNWTFCQPTKFYQVTQPDIYTTYQYNADKKPVLRSSFSYGNKISERAYTYNEQGQLIKVIAKSLLFRPSKKITVVLVDTIKFDYNTNGQIAKYVSVKYDTDLLTTIPSYSAICEYDAEGNRIKVTKTSPAYTEQYVDVFTYQGGNCIKAVYDLGLSDERSVELEYYLDTEDKLQKFRDLPLESDIIGYSASKNMLKRTSIASKQDNFDSNIVQYTYEFNQIGFPTKIKYAGSFEDEVVYEYDCQ